MSNVVVIVVNDINVDILRNQTKLHQYLASYINNVYYVYCKHKCAVKVNVVYVMK